MKKTMILFIIIVCLFVVSCQKERRCVECDDPPWYFDSYIPYSESDTILRFVNENNDTLESRIYVFREAVEVGRLNLFTDKYLERIDSPCRVLKKVQLTNNRINGIEFNKRAFVCMEVVECKFDQEGWFDLYSISWRSNIYRDSEAYQTDAYLKKEYIDFRNGDEMSYEIEIFRDDEYWDTTFWCRRFIIKRDKGLVEFEDMINSCTWKLIEE